MTWLYIPGRRSGQSGGGIPTYRFWRIYVTANDGDASYTSMAKLELLEGVTDRAFGLDTGQYTASTFLTSGTEPYQVGDNDPSSRWITAENFNEPCWLAVDVDIARPIDTVAITAPNQVGTANRTPADFLIQGNNTSAAEGAPWVTVKTITGSTGWTIGLRRTFSTI